MSDHPTDPTAPAAWTDLLDPTPEQLMAAVPPELRFVVRTRLAELDRTVPGRATRFNEPRPGLRVEHSCIVGVFVVPVPVPEEDRVFYQVVQVLVRPGEVVTIRRTPHDASGRRDEPFDIAAVQARFTNGDSEPSAGILTYFLVDEIAERFLDLADVIHDELDDVEEHVEDWPSDQVRQRISDLRHDMVHIRRTLSPTRDALHAIIDNRLEVHEELFPRDVEFLVSDVYTKMLRASEGLEIARDLLGGVRDYHQAKIAQDQNEVMKRLTAIASLLLVPTFIVGVYGQNFIRMPELRWRHGYLWSWALIVAVTAAQWVWFRRRRWI